jgi:hypothetical protein
MSARIASLSSAVFLGAAMFACTPASAQDDVTGSGTGFIVNSDGWIVTNAHVVESCGKASVPQMGATTEWLIDKQNDLAALRIAGATGRPALPLRTLTPRLGDDVAAFGYPLKNILSDSIKVTTGNINSLVGVHNDTRYLQISTALQPGNSGGPVVDYTGALTGVATAVLGSKFTDATGIVPQNVNFAVRSNIVEIFLQSRNVAFQTATEGTPIMSTADLSEKIAPSVVPILCHGGQTETAADTVVANVPAPKTAPAFRSLDNYDVVGFDYATLPNVSRSECQAACESDVSCRATTYNKKERFCFLKNDAQILVWNKDAYANVAEALSGKVVVSTFTVASGKDMAGGDYKRLRNSTFIGCYLTCEIEAQCAAFAFTRQQKDCWLKNRIGTVTNKSGVELGLK